MKKHLPLLIMSFLIINAFNSSAQVLPPELRKFRIYHKKKKPVKAIYKESRIRFNDEKKYDAQLKKANDDTFECYAEMGDLTSLQITKRRDTMNIHAYFSLLDIPFREGNYVIPNEYKMLFQNIKPEKGVKITNQNLKHFQVEQLPKGQIYPPDKTFIPDTLQAIPCTFWQKGYFGKLLKIKEQNLPHYAKGFYEDRATGLFYLWDDGNGYVSTDRGHNWELTPLSDDFIDSLYRNSLVDIDYMQDETDLATTEKFYPIFKKNYKNRDTEKVLYKVNIPRNRKEVILTLTNAWYARLTVWGDIWCVSAQGYMLVSRDEGKSWKYHVGDNYNVDVFEIIDGKYFFDGLRLYWIPE